MAAIAAGMKVVVDEGRWLATQASTSEEELRDRFAAALEADNIFLVLADDGEIVGCTGMHRTPVDGVWSLGTWLLPAFRGRGLGRRMLDGVLEIARAEGYRKLELEAFADNVAAIALYRSAGFEVEGLRRDHYEREDGTIRSAVVMALFPGRGRA